MNMIEMNIAMSFLMGLALGPQPYLPWDKNSVIIVIYNYCEVSCNLQMHMVHMHAAEIAAIGPPEIVQRQISTEAFSLYSLRPMAASWEAADTAPE